MSMMFSGMSTCVTTHATAPRSHLSMLGLTQQRCHKTVSAKLLLGSFGMVSGASHELERTRGKVTANIERNVSIHHTEHLFLNARSYRIVHSR
ncbi:hypothetical protein TNCV_4437661 [Trichonephila clavipes]|nr:hypothetical protein TNCV_4437661 [Trichonephila clavipes]